MKQVDIALLAIAERGHRVIRLEDVAEAGMSPRQWQRRARQGLWVPVVPGVWRHTAAQESFEVRVHAGARALGRDGALCGAAAAAWWGLDGFDRADEEVLFAVPRACRWQSSSWVRTTRDWQPGDLLWCEGVRVTSVTRVVFDLAAMGETSRRIEAAIDSGIRLRRTSVPTLLRRISQSGGRGRRGVPLLRELMLDTGGESALERRFLRLLRDAGLPRPRTQVIQAREAGRAMRVDFMFNSGLVVEVSGRLGHTSDRDRQRDSRRRNALQASGAPFVEFTTADVIEDPEYVISTVKHWVC